MLLVRAAEEHAPGVLGPEQVATATAAALDARSDVEILEKRTAYLYLRLPRALRSLARAALLPEDVVAGCLALTAAAGMLSNYMGPSGHIHVAYNPLTVLLGWNVAVLGLLAARRLGRRGRDRDAPAIVSEAPAPPIGAATTDPAPVHEAARPRPSNWLMARLYLRWRAWWAAWDGARASVEGAGQVSTAFLQSYHRLASSTLAARAETLLHVGAIGILVGALAGTYLRGLFFEYNAVWRSTFLTDPDTVVTFLNAFLAPATLLLDGRLLQAADVVPLLGAGGAPAGPWIHRLALTLAFVVIPARVALAVLAARRATSAASDIRIDLSEPYYAERIHAVRYGLGLRLREGVATAFRLEVARLSESVALFVCERFFDTAVAPILVGFRNRGGRICDLEEELRVATEKLQPELSAHLDAGQRELQRALVAQVYDIIGREVSLASDAITSSSPAFPLERNLTGPLASRFGDAIGATVTAAVAAGVATISGGLGKTLGVAVVSGLLHTSGPVGLLIGGVGAVAVVGGAYVLGRDRMTESIKGWSLPASVVSFALRDSKIEAARKATYAQVRRELESSLEPRIDDVTAAIFREIPLIAAARVSTQLAATGG